MIIPVVDCQNGGIKAHGEEIFKAITTVGFVYLNNYGLAPKEVSDVFNISDKFWTLSEDIKQKYARPKDWEREGNTGYVGPSVEILNPKSSAELREAFNFRPDCRLKEEIGIDAPGFIDTLTQFYDRCFTISVEIISVIAKGLDLPADFFDKKHSIYESYTTLRVLHYPPLPADIPPGSVRCGEHSDYGTITLLFQDEIGGLEVSQRDGKFVPATPVPDAVLVNTGDLLQRWTSDRILAVRHRVLIPEDKSLHQAERRSIAFFVHPNNDAVVVPLDNSKMYEPVTAREHLLNMFRKTY